MGKGLKSVLLNIGIFLLYIALGKFGLSLASINPSATAIWAPTGVALAVLLIFGYEVLPAIFLGALIVNFTTTPIFIPSLFIALGNTLEGVAGAYLVKKFANGAHAFDSVITIFKFAFLAAILSTTVSATIGVATLVISNLASLQNFWQVWSTWWLGDMGGDLIIAPLLLVWAIHPHIRFTLRGILHFALVFISITFIAWIVFNGTIPYAYLCIPLGVWIAFWFGRRGAASTTIIIAIIAAVNTLHGYGPFAQGNSINQSLLLPANVFERFFPDKSYLCCNRFGVSQSRENSFISRKAISNAS